MFFVYVLKSLKNNRLYTGHTDNLERRFFEHNSGKSKYTKLTKPFILIYKERFLTRSAAMIREKQLKSGQGRKWLKEKLAVGRAVA